MNGRLENHAMPLQYLNTSETDTGYVQIQSREYIMYFGGLIFVKPIFWFSELIESMRNILRLQFSGDDG